MALQLNPLLTEATVDLIVDSLKSQLNTLLKEDDNKYTDGINLTPIKQFYVSDKYETLQLPACYILFSDHAFNYTDDQNYLDSSDSCTVVITCEEIDAERLERKAWRYARVLYGALNLVSLKSGDDRLQVVCIPQRLGYSGVVATKLKTEQQKFRKDVVLELKLKHYEKNLI